MPEYFSSRYDVIAIGGSLATLTASIVLAKKGLKVLVLEGHDSPGGMATSFVRDGIEYEASLHEMMSIGTKQCPMAARRFLESHGVDVDWVRLPHAFRLVSPDGDYEIHAGKEGDFTVPAKDIAEYCKDDPRAYEKLMEFFALCAKMHEASDLYSEGKIGNYGMFKDYREFILTASYSVQQMFDHFELPKTAQEILSAYWVYLGSPMQDIPFSVYGYLLADYLGHGAYIPRHTSYEMSMKLALMAEEVGVAIEYCQPVTKIIVEKGKTKGVQLARGDILQCDQVLCGPYPHAAFGQMIDPKEVPEKAKRWVNAMDPCTSVFSVILLLDQEPASLGIHDYATFHACAPFDPQLSFLAN
ncbi:MAG: NAD(P)/FAD-dependent oxidoreductase, partial [Bacilli bacterium]|nr:NAD(P)/FAD-dependent oxidoreductase [Bacilli bacterium]